MCDKTYSILKDFVLQLTPSVPSEQMYIEDREDVDMYFRFVIIESNENPGVFKFSPEDKSHGTIKLTIMRGAGVRKTQPIRIGTYGKKSPNVGENTGLYVLFDVTPIQRQGQFIYQTNVQFQIKGGE